MKKRKNIAIPMILAATIAAVSVPCSSQIVMASDTYQVGVSKGYLALRSAMAYDSSNEIGELYSGDTVEVTEYTTSDYWYVYSPKLNRSGYVNNDYLYFLSSQPTSSSGSYTVSVAGIKNVIFHWYSGPLSLIPKIVEHGYYFSVNEKMTKTNSGIEIIKRIPRNLILTETDAPFNKVCSISNTLTNIGLGENAIYDNFSRLI